MTKDEAIYVLKNTAWLGSTGLVGDVTEAVKMAVEALKRETSDDAISRQAVIDICNNVIDLWQGQLGEGALVAIKNAINNLPSVQPERTEERTETHACDCVSRQAAIDATWKDPSYTDPLNVLTEVRDRIKALPSVQPEIVRCKDCRWQKDQSGSTAWLPCRALITPDDFYCGRAERRTDGTEQS